MVNSTGSHCSYPHVVQGATACSGGRSEWTALARVLSGLSADSTWVSIIPRRDNVITGVPPKARLHLRTRLNVTFFVQPSRGCRLGPGLPASGISTDYYFGSRGQVLLPVHHGGPSGQEPSSKRLETCQGFPSTAGQGKYPPTGMPTGTQSPHLLTGLTNQLFHGQTISQTNNTGH